MLRFGATIVLPGLLTLTMAAAPAAAGEPAAKKPTLEERLEELVKGLNKRDESVNKALLQLIEEVKGLKESRTDLQLEFGKLRAQLKEMKDEMDSLRRARPDTSLYPPGDRDGLAEVRTRLAQIEQMLERLGPGGRTANYAPGAVGRIVLANEYPEELLFIVNGESYRVAPNSNRVLEGQPAGAVTYEVISPTWGVRGRNTTTLADGGTFTLSARLP
jgi:hypothetical protein